MKLPRSWPALLVIVASAGLLAYALFGSSDEDRIMAVVRDLAHAVETDPGENVLFRRARIQKAFAEALEEDASIVAPELPATTGRKQLVELASLAPRAFGNVTLDVGATDIHVDGDEARAVSLVTLSASRGGELRREQRHVRFGLHEGGGSWRVRTIDVEPRSEAQPEARP